MRLHEVIGNIIKSNSSYITLSLDVSDVKDRGVFNEVLDKGGWVKVGGVTTVWQKAIPFGDEFDKNKLNVLLDKAIKKSKAGKVSAVYVVGTKAKKV